MSITRTTPVAALAALALAMTGTASAHDGEHASPFESPLEAGLFQQGLLPGSTGLRMPLGAASASAPADAGSGEDPSLRVYVLVVDGLQPQQVGDQTPELNALKDSGTWYQQARSVLPAETLPNHAAMMTGVVPAKNGIIANQFARDATPKEYMQHPELWDTETLITRLERATSGAANTATILSKEYLYSVFRTGFAGPGARVAQREADFHWDPRTQPTYVPYPSAHSLDAGTMDAFMGWLDENEGSPRPQFALVNLGDVDRAGHADVEGVATAAADRAVSGKEELSGRHAAPFQQAALEETDVQIGQLVDKLTKAGAWDETILLLLSDHGMDWGPSHQWLDTPAALAGYAGGDGNGSASRVADYIQVGGGGSEMIYVRHKPDITDMAQRLCRAPGVAVVATRRAVDGLGSTCAGRTLGELGLDHRYTGDIEVFLEPGWRSMPYKPDNNPVPGNHGHGVTQHSTLLVTGGHPKLKSACITGGCSIDGPQVHQPGNVAAPAGPGVLSVAPTVAGIFGLRPPAGGYDVPPLTEAFNEGALDLKQPEQPRPATPGGGEDNDPRNAQPEASPLLTIGVDVVNATLTQATYSFFVANRGGTVARNVAVTSAVPANTTLAASELPPLAGSCELGAAAATTCRWSLGDLGAGAVERLEVTYDLAQSATGYDVATTGSAQLGGQAPASGDPTDTDRSLKRRVLADGGNLVDAHIDDGAPGTNFGGCNVLQVGQGNAATALVDPSNFLNAEAGRLFNTTEAVWAAELRATAAGVTPGPSGPVELGAYRVAPKDWNEGAGTCTGGAPANAREATGASAPASEEFPTSTDSAAAAGDALAWDVRAALDTRRERDDFEGFELRLADAGLGAGAVTLHSGEAAAEPDRPRLIVVTTQHEDATQCIDADPEAAARTSDGTQRIPVYVTDGLQRFQKGGDDACNGTPVRGAGIAWEVEDDSPDVYISSLAGEPTEPETQGYDARPESGSTVTGPNGRSYIELRQGQPYAADQSAGATRLGAAVIKRQDGYNPPLYDNSQYGACETGQTQQWGAPKTDCTAENAEEDDVTITWTAAEAPAPGPSGGGDDGPGGGDEGTGGGDDSGGVDGTDGSDGTSGTPQNRTPAPAENASDGRRSAATLALRRTRLKVPRNRIVRVPIVCRNDPDGCRGVVKIRSRGRPIGRKRYTLAPGERARIRVRIRKSAARAIRQRGTAKAIVVAKNRKRVRLTSARSRPSTN